MSAFAMERVMEFEEKGGMSAFAMERVMEFEDKHAIIKGADK